MKATGWFCLLPQCSGANKKPQEKRNAQPAEGDDLEPANFTRYEAPYNRNADDIETFEDFVQQHARKCEIKRRKKAEKAEKAHKKGTLRRIFAVLTPCKAQPKTQAATFWIGAAPGYPERRLSGVQED